MSEILFYQCPKCGHLWKPLVTAHEATRCPRCRKYIEPKRRKAELAEGEGWLAQKIF